MQRVVYLSIYLYIYIDRYKRNVKSKIVDQIKQQTESSVDEMKFCEEDFQENVQRLSVLSSKDITDLANDWNKFTENNKIAQEKADKIIYDAMNKLNGEGNLMKRLQYQESRLKWEMGIYR